MKQLFLILVTALLIIICLPPTTPIVAQDDDVAHTIRIDLFERSWIEVTVDGSLLYNGIMDGDSWRVWKGDDIHLRIGNAGAVEVTHNEQSLGILGERDEVVTRHWSPNTLQLSESPITRSTEDPTTINNNIEQAEVRAPSYHLVEDGDTLYSIARDFNVRLNDLMAANNISHSKSLRSGQALIIPGTDGSLPDPAFAPVESLEAARPSLIERMTMSSRIAASNSPFHQTTWITFYGRPEVPVMGILGEYSIKNLIPVMKQQADAYDEANGPELTVMPAFHLVYGMATRESGEEQNYLSYLKDDIVMPYIEFAQQEGFGVILDIQIGALPPVEAAQRAFPYLQYDNVHLALDPEFAMKPDQQTPGVPIGFITGEEVNAVQSAMREYMNENKIRGRRVLIIHQFLDTMIVNKEEINRVYKIDLTISADGWGTPWGKISKYNSFIDESTKFAGIKLFYRWDEPLLNEREILGIDQHPDHDYIDITPNLIIYQ